MQEFSSFENPVLIHKFWRHFASNFNTIGLSQATLAHKILPVLLKQLRPDHIKQIIYLFVFPVRSGRQPNLDMKLISLQHILESISWQFMHLISNAQTPLNLLRHLEDRICCLSAPADH